MRVEVANRMPEGCHVPVVAGFYHAGLLALKAENPYVLMVGFRGVIHRLVAILHQRPRSESGSFGPVLTGCLGAWLFTGPATTGRWKTREKQLLQAGSRAT